MITITKKDFSEFETRKRVQFINSLSGYKSANLIGTINSKGQTNLSIMSSAFHLGADPALMGLIVRPDSSPRHTLNNIRETGLCTLNHVNSKIYKQAHQTSARYPEDISEFSACNLEEEYINSFNIPFVKESMIKIGLKLEEEKKIDLNGTHLLILSIQEVHLGNNFIESDGKINIDAADSVCVSGLDSYHSPKLLECLPYAKV